MQTPDSKTTVVDMQPKGNLPMMKPDDMQYFDKLLVSTLLLICWYKV
jgi:splicing factor 3B subunit 1